MFFASIIDFFKNLFDWTGTVTVFGLTLTFTFSGIIEIILFSFAIFAILRWIRNTKAFALLKGAVILLVFYVVANFLKLDNIVYLFQTFAASLFLAVVIVFHPEIRKALEQLGSRIGKKNAKGDTIFAGGLTEEAVENILEALEYMGRNRVGALIVVEREIRLDEFIETGIKLDAEVSVALVEQIFEKNTPLHDGAVIIRGGRICAATCYLPLSQNMDISKELGTRHRAGLGVSDVSDCITLIASEETGKLSVAMEGKIETAVDRDFIRSVLMSSQSVRKKSSNVFAKWLKGGK